MSLDFFWSSFKFVDDGFHLSDKNYTLKRSKKNIQVNVFNFSRIVNTFAEEAALEDTIYYLGEAFMRERLELEQYLKNVRALSRKQFMHRVLLQRCRAKAGLAG